MKDRREAIAGLLLRLRAMGLPHPLMAAFESVPRQNFVPVMHIDESYGRGQLPIECGQVMVSADQIARSLLALGVEKTNRVLEIGTGSGYQAALLGRLALKVTSLERFRTLADKATQRISSLGIENVEIILADGSEGSPGKAFDRIVINCSCPKIPEFLGEQLASRGVAIVPIGPPDGVQTLTRIAKSGSRMDVEPVMEVRLHPCLSGIARAI